jgi:hypothetical protein
VSNEFKKLIGGMSLDAAIERVVSVDKNKKLAFGIHLLELEQFAEFLNREFSLFTFGSELEYMSRGVLAAYGAFDSVVKGQNT